LKKPNAYTLYLIMGAAHALFSSMIFTVLTVYYVQTVGMNPLQLVLVGTTIELTVLLFEIPTGVVADLYSRRLAVIIGFVHVYLPIMILPIYASARNLDKRYIEAAYDLGATPLKAFLRVVLPLTMPGIVAGIVLFFIPTFGSFVTPQLLGGTRDVMMGNIIDNQFGEAFNWPFGAALSIVMTLVVIVAMTLFFRFADVEDIYGR